MRNAHYIGNIYTYYMDENSLALFCAECYYRSPSAFLFIYIILYLCMRITHKQTSIILLLIPGIRYNIIVSTGAAVIRLLALCTRRNLNLSIRP